MKNKKGFISTSIIYSFFIVFLLIMLSMLASYINKRYLTVKYEDPEDLIKSKCEDLNLPFADCLIKNDICKDAENSAECISNQYKDDNFTPDEKKIIKADSGCVTEEQKGLKRTKDNFGTTLYYSGNVDNNYVYYAGHMWQIVRINGDSDHSVRLIYAGEATGNKNPKLDKDSMPYITVNNVYEELGSQYDQWKDINAYKTRYNYFWIMQKNQQTCTDLLKNVTINENNVWSPLYNLAEATGGVLVTREDILKCMAQITGNDKRAIEQLGQNKAGGILLWNIGYMNNHTHWATYDSILDNQDDSELKMWIDMWYEKNIYNNSSYTKDIYYNEIFCGDKNLTKSYFESDSKWEQFKNKLDLFSKGRFTFAGYNRIGDADHTGTGATIVCTNSGSVVRPDKLKYHLGYKVLNLSNYSAKDPNAQDEDDYLIYEKCYGLDCPGLLNDVSNAISNGIDTIIDVLCPRKCVEWGKCKSKWGITYNCCKAKESICENSESNNDGDSEEITTSGKNYHYYYTDTTSNGIIRSDWKDSHEIIPSPVKNLSSELNITSNKDEYKYVSEGNKQLKYPIGLLSADEAIYAGARTSGCESYLFDDYRNIDLSSDNNGINTFWTMTLAYSNLGLNEAGGNGARYYVVAKDSKGTKVMKKDDTDPGQSNNIGSYIRPVINVNNVSWGNYCAKGEKPGTWDNPYIIGGSCS